MAHRRMIVALSLLAVLVPCAAWPGEADKAAEIARQMEPVLGTDWYGVYMAGGQKCGFAKGVIAKDKWRDEDVYNVRMGLIVNITMGGGVQKLMITEKRYYRLTGELCGIETIADTVGGKAEFAGEVKGDKLVLSSTMAGRTSKTEVPAPAESLDAILATRRLVEKGEINGAASFELFEPTTASAMKITTKLLRFEQKLIGGIATRVGVLETNYAKTGISSTDYVTTDGVLLETVIGGMFTLRREPERLAKDVKAVFDAVRAGIIPVKEGLGNPRRVRSLKLQVSGVSNKEMLLNDDRQTYGPGEEGKEAVYPLALRTAEAPANPLPLPITPGPDDKDLSLWLKPSAFIQSDAPEMVKAAKEIAGDAKDSYEAACRIQKWVYKNVDKVGLAAMSNALEVLRTKKGDCSEHSVLFVALCRAAGIPARQALGIGYSDEMKGFGYHAWAEVYVGKWVAMDPTWGENLADATHVKFGLGDTESMATIGGLFGSLKIEVLEVNRGK